MTRRDVPPASPSGPAPSSSSSETEYVRKLSLAILSTLQSKGLLSADEVDAILIAARRAAQLPGAAAQARPGSASPPAPAGTQPAPAMQVTVQPPGSLTWHTTPPSAASGEETNPTNAEAAVPGARTEEATPERAEAGPPVTDASGELDGQPDSKDADAAGGEKPEPRPQPPMFDIKLD
ncbi:hypothetical protein [Deinococcus budaensis]|uniref:Uncharacterized protein n=1 Tax=Deinococcus budaensis TaxID=1665626 RepID=A0A7W8GD47_9DEIO|nr:hypothetical protein [Deinococcus budaensis]MBB5233395.1 hypothetical protein [Deinococcus budaensis]